MSISATAIAKAAATVLSNEKLRKGVGWILVAVLSPLILLIAVLCSMATGEADHNNQTVAACFTEPSSIIFCSRKFIDNRVSEKCDNYYSFTKLHFFHKSCIIYDR